MPWSRGGRLAQAGLDPRSMLWDPAGTRVYRGSAGDKEAPSGQVLVMERVGETNHGPKQL